MVRDLRIKDYVFNIGSLTSASTGLLDVYSDHTINGQIQSIAVGSNTYTNTGSLLIYISGTDNSVQRDLILRLRVGSMMTTFYPNVNPIDSQMALGSATTAISPFQYISNAPIRIVGSGLGNAASGLYLQVRYI